MHQAPLPIYTYAHRDGEYQGEPAWMLEQV